MGRLRLDIVNDKKVRVLQVTEKVDNGAFGYITGIKNVDDLGRETYEFKKFPATGEIKGQVVFVADDGHRYEDVRMTTNVSLMRPAAKKVPYFAVANDGFDVVVDPNEEAGITRGYGLEPLDLISVEPHVLLGGDPVTTVAAAKAKVAVGDLLKPKADSYNLEKTTSMADAIAQVDGVELLSGYPVIVIRFL